MSWRVKRVYLQRVKYIWTKIILPLLGNIYIYMNLFANSLSSENSWPAIVFNIRSYFDANDVLQRNLMLSVYHNINATNI